MTTNIDTAAPSSTRPRTLWARFLDVVLPAPAADRLVRVAEVSRGVLPLAEGSLADVAITPVIQETTGPAGNARFVVLVQAQDAQPATAVLASLV